MKSWTWRTVVGLGRRRKEALLLLVVFLSLYPVVSSERTPLTTLGHEAVSVWSRITIGLADAYSTFGEKPIEDCLRPQLVDCFSVQQNFWISDSAGNFVLWAQNTIELAKVRNEIYYGTFTFQVWTNGKAQPELCEPESSITRLCRAPFYTTPLRFPQSFIFYSHISNEGSKYVLEMSNNLGAVSWDIPGSVRCPCYIGTVLENVPPWGHSPFELVMVGLDSLAIAAFRNDTTGTFGPVLVESADGIWHEGSVSTIQCHLSNCLALLATGESSMNLVWNSTSMEFHWSHGGLDQGVNISAVSAGVVDRPPLPNPIAETYLYAEFKSLYAYLTIYDEEQRALGVNPQTGNRVEEIPNASMTHDSSEDLLIVKPTGVYELVVTAGGNTPFQLFVSKSTNIGDDVVARHYNGTLNVGSSERFHLSLDDMNLIPEEAKVTVDLRPIAGIVVAVVGFILIITAILIFRRRRDE